MGVGCNSSVGKREQGDVGQTDERTREYLARRQAEGKSKREVVRCLKRYVAREIYHVLQRLGPGVLAA
jgi:hypothetical protein